MSLCLKSLLVGSTLCLFAMGASVNAAPEGFLEGHLKIYSPKEVDLADPTPPKVTQNYAEYPLVVLSADRKTEVARVTPDENGNYRVALLPGEYVLDVKDRMRRHVRARPQPFTVIAGQTAHVDMNLDTGVR